MIVVTEAQARRAARQRQLEGMENAAAGGPTPSFSSVDTSGIDMLMGESSLRSRSSRGGRSIRSTNSGVFSPEGSTDGTMGSDSILGNRNNGLGGGASLLNKVVSAPSSSVRNVGVKPRGSAQAAVSGAPLLKPLTGGATGNSTVSGSGGGGGGSNNTGSKSIASGGGFFTQRNRHYDVDQSVNLMNADAATYERRGSPGSTFTSIIREICTPRRALIIFLVIVAIVSCTYSIRSMGNAKSSAFNEASVGSIDNTMIRRPLSEEDSFSLQGTKAEQIKELIINEKVSHFMDFDDQNSPQSKALRWITDEDKYDLEIDYKNKDTILQRYGLMVLFHSTKAVLAVASDGFFGSSKEVTTEWTNNDNWGTNTSYCSWYGVSCILTDDFPTNFANTLGGGSNLKLQNDVITLNLTSNNLVGKIPAELAKSLLQVREVDLSSNSFTGTIPYNLYRMFHLRYLILSHNSLTGTISTEIEKFEGARDIFLDGNKLTGTLPSEINRLYNLRGLYLNDNYLTGSIPNLHGMNNIAFLHIQSNEFNKFFPFSVARLTTLFDLRMQNNQISGTIPPEIDNLSHLEIFYAYQNNLGGKLPNVFGDLNQLVDLRLQSNDFTKGLPKTIGQCVNLKHLILDGNEITGKIPSEYGNLVDLETLILSNNTLVGAVPSEFGRLTSLTELWLNRNFLQHELPTELGEMSSLQKALLEHNAFAATVPSEIGNLKNLVSLRLATNQVTGTMPAEICRLKDNSLQFLDADCREPKITCTCCNVCH